MESGAQLKSVNDDEPWKDNFRLPNSTYPEHYELYMHPDLKTKTFTGNVTITVNSSEPTDYFVVHTQWLNITKTTITKVDGLNQEVNVTSAFEYPPNQYWVMQTEEVESGTFELYFEFSGSLTNTILGFYYSEYTNPSGDQRGLATTKFEPTYARRAFPCFDEPSFKSTYDIAIVRPTNDSYIALSNMPVQKTENNKPSEGLSTVTFQTSVPMVTYLACFIVSDFAYIEEITQSGMPFRVYAPPHRVEKTEYALSTGVNILGFYEALFDIPFPLPKCDMAAIPDYSSGATEHWGIITYREANLYYSENTSSAYDYQKVTTVIAHEMAHQWFGNLVTLLWWNDLWLNEGFARFVEYKGADHVHPTWDMQSQFLKVIQDVFVLDSKLSSHPIIQTVDTPDQINAIFDDISYDKQCQFLARSLSLVMVKDAKVTSHPIIQHVNSTDRINSMFDVISYLKGASVLRMLEDFMGEEYFQLGVNNFLKKYAYKNAVTQDLWDELNAVWSDTVPVGQKNDVAAIMDTWTIQMGYPVVTAVRTMPDTVTLTQRRFLENPTVESDPSTSPYGYKWDIPISYTTSENSAVLRSWLYLEDDEVTIQIDPNATWFKINSLERGYYRVNYEIDIWDKLKEQLQLQTLRADDRAQLYDDALALANAALIPYDTALNLTEVLVSETHYVPWYSASERLTDIIYLLLETDVYEPFKEYVAQISGPVYDSLGWNDTGDHLQRLLRNTIVSLSCISNHENCLVEASSLLDPWISNSSFLLPVGTTREIYHWGIIRSDNPVTWTTMWIRCMAQQDAAERDNLYFGLANSQDEATLLRYIELSQNEENVRTQDFLNVLQYIAGNPAGTDLVWYWIRENWEWLVDRYTLNDRYLGQLIPNVSRYFATPEKLIEMETFFLQYPDAGAGESGRKEALDTVKANINWVRSYSSVIKNWLDARQ